MNPTSFSSPATHPGMEKFFIHHFNYNINNIEDNIKAYEDKYKEIVGISPDKIMLRDDNKTLYVKLQTKKETVHNINILNKLMEYGIELKLSKKQADQNSIFCLGIPAALSKNNKKKIIKSIEYNQKDLKVMDIYMLPIKSEDQVLTSIKITLATQEMVDKTMSAGISICNHQVKITQISRARVLGTSQCFRCFSFDHPTESCQYEIKCLHCCENHLYKDCQNKSKRPTCANCNGAHKSNSNRCTIKKKHLIVPVSSKDPEIQIVKNPESTYKEASIPTTNPWFNKNKNHDINPQQQNMNPVPNPSPSATPATSNNQTANYSDVLNMALKFNNWTLAFTELQKAFGLPPVQIPNSIINDLKPEFAGNSTTLNIPPPAAELSYVRTESPELDISLEQIDINKDPLISESQTSFTLVNNNKKKYNKTRAAKKNLTPQVTPQESPSTSSSSYSTIQQQAIKKSSKGGLIYLKCNAEYDM